MKQFDFGSQFRQYMQEIYFDYYPEITHQWSENQLIIFHPFDVSKVISFKYDTKKIIVSFDNSEKVFRKNLFQKNAWIFKRIVNYTFKKLSPVPKGGIINPKIKPHEYLVSFAARATGEVLTTNGNIYIGWGECFLKFDALEVAQKYCDNINSELIEYYIHDYQENVVASNV